MLPYWVISNYAVMVLNFVLRSVLYRYSIAVRASNNFFMAAMTCASTWCSWIRQLNEVNYRYIMAISGEVSPPFPPVRWLVAVPFRA